MGTQIAKLSYWIGALCTVLVLVARALNVMGMDLLVFPTRGRQIDYHTFLDASLLFYAVSIATTVYLRLSTEKP